MTIRRQVLTEEVVNNLEPEEKKYTVWDTQPQNLCVIVYPTGGKTFWFIKTVNKRTERQAIAAVGQMPVKEVRKIAYELNGKVARGESINDARRAKKTAKTVAEAWEQRLEEIKETKRSWAHEKYLYEKYLSPLATRRLIDISVDFLNKFFKNLRDSVATNPIDKNEKTNKRGAPLHNQIRCVFHAIFEKAKDIGEFSGENPVKKIKLLKMEHRTPLLSDEQQKKFLEEIAKEGEIYLDFFCLMLLLGQRLGNIRDMEWKELDLEHRVWCIPSGKFKTKKQHAIPLCKPAVEILEKRKKSATGRYVFESDKKGREGKSICSPKEPFHRAIKRAKIEGFRMYDCRHQCASNLLKDGAPLIFIKDYFGHTNLLQSSKYSHLEAAQQRQYVESMGEKVGQWMNNK